MTHLVPRPEGVRFMRGALTAFVATLFGCGLIALWWFSWQH